jgi:hypothetical protein
MFIHLTSQTSKKRLSSISTTTPSYPSLFHQNNHRKGMYILPIELSAFKNRKYVVTTAIFSSSQLLVTGRAVDFKAKLIRDFASHETDFRLLTRCRNLKWAL